MAVLTSPQAHGPLLASLARFLGEEGPTETGRVSELFCPPDASGAWPPALFTDTLKAGVALGVIKESQGKLAAKAHASPDDLHVTLRGWVFNSDVVAPALFGRTSPGGTDLVRGLCWLLSLDPHEPPVSTDSMEERQRGLGLPRLAVPNPEQYRAVARWAVWLGLAQPLSDTGTDIVPDLRGPLRDVLADVTGSIDLDDVSLALAKRVPAADGGWARQRYLDETDETDADTLSPALSHALQSLEFADELRLSHPADSAIVGRTARHLFGSGSPVSLVEVLR
jgi:hypothetical protein